MSEQINGNQFKIIKIAEGLYNKFIEPYMDGFEICKTHLPKKKSFFGSTNLLKSVTFEFSKLVGTKIIENKEPHANLILMYHTIAGNNLFGGAVGAEQIFNENNKLDMNKFKDLLVAADNKDKTLLNNGGGKPLQGGKPNNTLRRKKVSRKSKY